MQQLRNILTVLKITLLQMFFQLHYMEKESHKKELHIPNRGRPWRYSVIPRTPDFQTEYQIRRNSNPAGIPVFAAIWGPDFRPSIIILTNMFKQIKQIRITLMTMFKVDPSPPNELR